VGEGGFIWGQSLGELSESQTGSMNAAEGEMEVLRTLADTPTINRLSNSLKWFYSSPSP
jgi:hypothetical protein